MKIGVLTAMLSGQPLEKALDYVAGAGVKVVELGSGNYPGNAHCNPNELLASETKRKQFMKALSSRGLTISALSCHGNPLHPVTKVAKAFHETHRKTVQLAEKLGIDRVVNFSGCPGDSEKAKAPNWVTCPWPPDYSEVLKWQWEKKVIPYWRAEAAFARKYKVKLCFEMHPGFVVYNTETMLKLRKTCGDNIGANFDPSHLFWQGMDPVESIRALGKAIFHFHAKDCKVYEQNSRVNGVLDTKHYGDELNRSWIFRTVGFGHGEDVWTDIISTLKMVGYDDVISIEHEDSLMSMDEGFKKAVAFLNRIVIQQKTGGMWWA
jgi:sugar phosphate isomerase/epimerase